GHDTRLDRPVALKRVKASISESAAHDRFRREGRALARVRHPSVVEVHDWIEHDDGAWLVMELLEGRPLSELLEEGPIELPLALHMALEITAGLAAVHSQGIVHRDLKPSNVIILLESSSGRERGGGVRAKLIDFGLAKPIVSLDELASIESISREGQLIGTVRFMSPEQAVGRPVDERSDLFSLGLILYEMLTGVPPFGTGSGVEVLTRICTVKETPVRQLFPQVPPALSELVHSLLEKDPGWRPTRAAEVELRLDRLLRTGAAAPSSATLEPAADEPAAGDYGQLTTLVEPDSSPGGPPEIRREMEVSDRPPARRVASTVASALLVLLLAGVGWHQIGSLASRSPPHYVAVPRTVVLGEDPSGEVALEASAIHAGLLQALRGYRGLAAVQPAASDPEIEDPRQLATAVGADETLVSELECANDCQIVFQRIDARDGSVLWSHRFTSSTASLLASSHLADEQVRGGYSHFPLRRDAHELRVRPEDYETFLRLQHQYLSAARSDTEILARLQAVRETSPNFVGAHTLAASILRQRFSVTRDEASLELALALLQQALRIAPDHPLILRRLALNRIEGGELEEAEAVLDALARSEPGDAGALAWRALVAERRGHQEEAIAMMRRAVERQGSVNHWIELGDMYRRMGQTEEARGSLDKALELYPEHYGALSRLATLELLEGSLERGTHLFERLVERSPAEAELTNLGVAYLLLGHYEPAIGVFERVLEIAPSSPFAMLNLADAKALRGEPTAAAELYRRTVERVHADPDADRLLTVGAQALAHLGRHEEAIAAVQRALRLEPDNPQVIFESALVYLLAGESTSALLHARRALELGMARRWFEFEWFDPLRADLEPATARGSDSKP
ncbi:MAG: tetratricopeptide repeat protein, partial [Holophagales bacterium]|nr:tetratricopeptide repeat protein [Holophagales bacterium]